ncbi:hypothetical protein ACIRRH_26675 [Kitasatospora sp. NPDC101235]|uniref:hypothetical protein n=1 Tax=Kitasatospora sp. NPDC101235 TaxID=3364101 RepID=UPI00381B4656
MSTDRTGRILGAVLGLVFIQTGAGYLPAAVEVSLRMISVAAFLVLLGAGKWWGGRAAPLDRSEGKPKTVVGQNIQYIASAGGLAVTLGITVVNRLLHTPLATMPWIATVVGVQLFIPAALWRRPSLYVLGGAISLFGVVGLVLAFGGASEATVGTVAEAVPGVLLLGSVCWSARPQSAPGRTTTTAA